jgi:hypothetical protein
MPRYISHDRAVFTLIFGGLAFVGLVVIDGLFLLWLAAKAWEMLVQWFAWAALLRI